MQWTNCGSSNCLLTMCRLTCLTMCRLTNGDCHSNIKEDGEWFHRILFNISEGAKHISLNKSNQVREVYSHISIGRCTVSNNNASSFDDMPSSTFQLVVASINWKSNAVSKKPNRSSRLYRIKSKMPFIFQLSIRCNRSKIGSVLVYQTPLQELCALPSECWCAHLLLWQT